MPEYCVVIHAFTATKPDEMNLNVGEVIEVIRKEDDGWWLGRKTQTDPANADTRSLWFPSNFTVEPEGVDLSRKGKPLRYMKIQFPYAAKEPDELNLAVGDVVVIIDTDEEPGWFRGVHRGKVGVLPSNFGVVEIKGSIGSGDHATNPKSEKRRQSLVGGFGGLNMETLMASKAASPGPATHLASPQSAKIETVTSNAAAVTVKAPNNATPAAAPVNNNNSSSKKAIVKFEYKALQPDELTLTKGATLTLLSKEEDGWWRGVDESGREGVFPVNFVDILPDVPAQEEKPALAAKPKRESKLPANAVKLPFADFIPNKPHSDDAPASNASNNAAVPSANTSNNSQTTSQPNKPILPQKAMFEAKESPSPTSSSAANSKRTSMNITNRTSVIISKDQQSKSITPPQLPVKPSSVSQLKPTEPQSLKATSQTSLVNSNSSLDQGNNRPAVIPEGIKIARKPSVEELLTKQQTDNGHSHSNIPEAKPLKSPVEELDDAASSANTPKLTHVTKSRVQPKKRSSSAMPRPADNTTSIQSPPLVSDEDDSKKTLKESNIRAWIAEEMAMLRQEMDRRFSEEQAKRERLEAELRELRKSIMN